MFRAEKITDLNDLVRCDVETRAPISDKFRKVDLSKIAEIQYIKDRPTYMVHVGERQEFPYAITKALGCANGYCITIDDKFKVIGACMNALQHGYYACIVLWKDKVSLVHAPTLRVDKEDTLKVEDLEELEWDRDQL